jgi:hypothetical protein
MVLTYTSLAVLCLWVLPRHDPLLATLLVRTVFLSIRLTILSASCIRPQKTAWLALRLVLGWVGFVFGGIGLDRVGSSIRSFTVTGAFYTLRHDSYRSKSKHLERLGGCLL